MDVVASEAAAGSIVQSTDLLVMAYERHSAALLDYVIDQLGPLDWRDGEDLAAEVWLRMAEHANRVDQRVMDLTWLRAAARGVIRAHGSPVEIPMGMGLPASRVLPPAPLPRMVIDEPSAVPQVAMAAA